MTKTKAPWHYLFLLVLAGEAVFILPFVLPRIFRPTLLSTFELSNTELGLSMSVYGVIALGSYLIGGPLADRFAPRKLIASALWLTALGGVVMATYPAYEQLRWLYGYWGFTTIFLFWAPMIKATRIWGGSGAQGWAFGLLDGGRGLVGALFGAAGVLIFSNFLAEGSLAEGNLAESRAAFRYVLLAASGAVALVGVLVWFFLRNPAKTEQKILVDRITITQLRTVIRLPAVPLLMAIILCAYVGYKVTDVVSLYASDVMGYDEVGAARIGTLLLFLRPVVGVSVGLLADRFLPANWLFYSFALTIVGGILFASGSVTDAFGLLFFLSVLIVGSGTYAARALYFAVMESGNIPLALTGTAVGLISLIGYTPDIFISPLLGYFLDGWPGIVGHQLVFGMLTAFSVVGAVAAWRYILLVRSR